MSSAKRRSVLTRQVVRRRKRNLSGRLWRAAGFLGKGILKILVLAVLLATTSLVLLAGYHYLLTSPYLRLERIQMTGVDASLRQVLLRECRLTHSVSLLSIDLYKLKQEMERNPWVKTARLERQLPDTLVIDVERQQPLAMVLTDRLHYMNREGELFKEVTGSENKDFPVVTGWHEESGGSGKVLKRIAGMIEGLKSERGHWSLRGLSEIHLRKDGRISLYYSHVPAEINADWGDLKEKMAKLKEVVAHLSRTGRIHDVRRIDLSYGEGIVVSFDRG